MLHSSLLQAPFSAGWSSVLNAFERMNAVMHQSSYFSCSCFDDRSCRCILCEGPHIKIGAHCTSCHVCTCTLQKGATIGSVFFDGDGIHLFLLIIKYSSHHCENRHAVDAIKPVLSRNGSSFGCHT
jgi:hypothetical protein